MIAAVAARQHGNITTRQLLELGASEKEMRHRVGSGRLFRVFRGVYAVGHSPTTPIERAAAAVLTCGPGAALSHGSAMVLWGFWKRWDTPFEVSTTLDRRPPGIAVHRTATLTPRDTVPHQGIRTTTPARTIFDIASRLDDNALARAYANALISKKLHESQLIELMRKQTPRHPTIGRFTPLLRQPTGTGPTRSDWERALPAFCRDWDLPVPVMGAKRGRHTVDAYFPNEGLILELDSWDAHQSRYAFENDRDRDADSLLLGDSTVRLTWDRMHKTPGHEAERLNGILALLRRRRRTA
jgi:Transcriptional regulator, AbiEi antitoxin